MHVPQSEDRISRACPAKLNQTVIKHQMFQALIFLMRNGSMRSGLVSVKYFMDLNRAAHHLDTYQDLKMG